MPRPAQSEEQQQHHLQHSQRHHAVPGPSSSAPTQRNQRTSSPKIQRHHAVPGPSSSAPNQRNQTTSSPKIQRHQAVHRRTSSSAAAAMGNQRQHSVGNNMAVSSMAPPKLIRSSPSPSLPRRHYHDDEQHQQQLQHRGSVASSVAALATVLAAAPTSLRNNTNNNNEQLRRSRQRPLAVPEATEATPQNQYFLAVPGSSASGGLSSSLSASISMVPGSGGGWTSQPASPMLADRPLPPLFSASSCSPLPTTNNHQLNHHHREHVQQYHRRHDAAVLSEPNVSRSAKQQQPPLMPFLRSLRQLKLFKRRSVSELSLVLELLRGGGTIFGGRAETDDGASDGYSTHNGAEDEELELDNSELSQHRHHRFRHHTASPMPASGVERHRHATVRRTATTLTRRTTQRSQQRRTRRRFPWAHYSPGAIQRRFVHG